MQQTVNVERKSGQALFAKRLSELTRLSAYVGVPSSNRRKQQLKSMAGKVTGQKRKAKLARAAQQDVSNAELLFIHTNGSPANNIPKRPVLQPAVLAEGNRQAIASELSQAAKAQLEGNPTQAKQRTQRAALAGQNAARNWFTDSRNNWAPNKPATIRRKGSDKPLVDNGALRASIIGFVEEDKA